MLDLKKLKALELPKKEIEVAVLGEKQKITISAFGDDVSLNLSDITEHYKDETEIRCRKMLLLSCVEGMTEADADLLLRKAGLDVNPILRAIFELTDEFNAERKRIREQAEKNSKAGAAENAKA